MLFLMDSVKLNIENCVIVEIQFPSIFILSKTVQIHFLFKIGKQNQNWMSIIF